MTQIQKTPWMTFQNNIQRRRQWTTKLIMRLWIWTVRVFVPRLLSAPLTLFFSSLDSHGAALFVPKLVVYYMVTMEGEKKKKKRCDLRLWLRTLISQSSWLHKSFLMYDTRDNSELHLLFTVQHQGSSGVGSPPAPLLLTCVVLTRRAAMIKHWLRNKGRRVQVSRPDARIQPCDATRFQEPLWNQLRLLCPAALGSPLLVPFSGWLGWGLHHNPTGAAGTNPICCQNPLFIHRLDYEHLLEMTLTKGAWKRSEGEMYQWV